jgi:predicted ATPase
VAGIAAARRLLALEPWREEAHRQLMVLLARSGQRGAALKQFEACRRVLAEELATAPEPATVALAARLRAGPQPVPHNLPPEPVPLVGREAELGQLAEHLRDPACRLLSLVGLGGSGKTRLALEAAHRLVDAAGMATGAEFPDGVFLVPLDDAAPPSDAGGPALRAAPAAEGAELARAVAGVLGIALDGPDGPGDPMARLAEALRERTMLLVLDNLEHSVEAAPALWQLLRRAPGVTLLVTSRVRLRLLGQRELEVRGLTVPEGPADVEWAAASVLFLQQARGARPRPGVPALGAADREAIVRICRLTGGLPLPLLLAAAWAPARSCVEIAAELAQAVDLPGTPLRGLPARQRRVRDVLGAAWDRLPAADRAALAWLPLFRGGFTREAARAVLGVSPQQLLTLLDGFLVAPTDDGRYELEEVVGRFVGQFQPRGPEERTATMARFADYYADFVQQRETTMQRSRQALTEMGSERLNIAAAWDWAAAHGQIELLDRMRHGRQRFQQLSAPHVPPALAAPVFRSPSLSPGRSFGDAPFGDAGALAGVRALAVQVS